jgi:hypothetical protein
MHSIAVYIFTIETLKQFLQLYIVILCIVLIIVSKMVI